MKRIVTTFILFLSLNTFAATTCYKLAESKDSNNVYEMCFQYNGTSLNNTASATTSYIPRAQKDMKNSCINIYNSPTNPMVISMNKIDDNGSVISAIFWLTEGQTKTYKMKYSSVSRAGKEDSFIEEGTFTEKTTK